MKYSKEDAEYTDHSNNPNEKCKLCEYTLYPLCQKVRGLIKRGGWCRFFERDPNK